MTERFEETYLPPPPEFEGAPPWAYALWYQNRRDQHTNASALGAIEGRVVVLEKKLGEEPDSQGKGGKGLIGDMHQLKALRNQGIGFVAAIGLTGALLLAGIAHWVQTLLPKATAAH